MVVNFDELENAYLFVSSDPYSESIAVIDRETGEFYYYSEFNTDSTDSFPEDYDDEEKYIIIPNKHYFELDNRLAFRFVQEYIPEAYGLVREMFRREGAYARFKGFLNKNALLKKWYDYQDQKIKEALLNFCKEEGLEVDMSDLPKKNT